MLAKLKLPPLNAANIRPKLERVDVFGVALSDDTAPNLMVQAKFVAEYLPNQEFDLRTTARMYRIQVLTPLGRGAFCAAGSDLSADRLDESTNAGPADGMHDENTPLTFRFLRLTHTGRLTVEVVTTTRTISRVSGVTTEHAFWDLAGGRLVNVLRLVESDVHCAPCDPDFAHQRIWFELSGEAPKVVRSHSLSCTERGVDGGASCNPKDTIRLIFVDGGYVPG